MREINVSDFRRNLPGLVEEVNKTREPIVITRRGVPQAKIVPCSQEGSLEELGPMSLRGLPLEMSEDFDEGLEEEWEALEP